MEELFLLLDNLQGLCYNEFVEINATNCTSHI